MGTEYYLLLAKDSFLGAFLFSFNTEIVSFAMLAFGGYPEAVVLLVAFLCSSAAMLVNWAIGRGIAAMTHSVSARQKENMTYLVFSQNARKYGKWVLPLLPWFSVFANPVAAFAGFVGIKLNWFVMLMMVGRAAYYASAAILY